MFGIIVQNLPAAFQFSLIKRRTVMGKCPDNQEPRVRRYILFISDRIARVEAGQQSHGHDQRFCHGRLPSRNAGILMNRQHPPFVHTCMADRRNSTNLASKSQVAAIYCCHGAA